MEWQKPARCAADRPQCPEVLFDGSDVLIRSNTDPDKIVKFADEEWDDFIDAIKAGEYDR